MPELTIPEAAAALGVSVDTIRRKLKRGELVSRFDTRGRYLVEVDLPSTAQQGLGESVGTTSNGLGTAEQTRLADLERELEHTCELLSEVKRQRDQLEHQVQVKDEQLGRAEHEREQLRILLGNAQQLARALPAPTEQPAEQSPATTVEHEAQPAASDPRPWWRFW